MTMITNPINTHPKWKNYHFFDYIAEEVQAEDTKQQQILVMTTRSMEVLQTDAPKLREETKQITLEPEQLADIASLEQPPEKKPREETKQITPEPEQLVDIVSLEQPPDDLTTPTLTPHNSMHCWDCVNRMPTGAWPPQFDKSVEVPDDEIKEREDIIAELIPDIVSILETIIRQLSRYQWWLVKM